MEYNIKNADGRRNPTYLKGAERLFSAQEREGVVAMIAGDPECREVIQGTGGFRKVRVGRGGTGKQGGARVIYILRNESFPVFLIAMYSNNEKANLNKNERNHLAKIADLIFARYAK